MCILDTINKLGYITKLNTNNYYNIIAGDKCVGEIGRVRNCWSLFCGSHSKKDKLNVKYCMNEFVTDDTTPEILNGLLKTVLTADC